MLSLHSFARRSLAAGALVVSVLAGILTSAGSADAAGTCSVVDGGLDVEERAFVSLINDYRAARNLSQLTVSTTLTRAAAWMASDLGARTQFGHDDSLGRPAQQRIADCGYAGPAGENLAAGTAWDSASRALDAWKASPHHNENMLYAPYVQIGVARLHVPGSQYGWYWVTTFGTENDGTNLLTGSGTAARPLASSVDRTAGVQPLWVNDLTYGSRGGGFYWDPRSGSVWTGERSWHAFTASRRVEPLWVNDLDYPSAGQGFYLDARAGQVWTGECGWHAFSRFGC